MSKLYPQPAYAIASYANGNCANLHSNPSFDPTEMSGDATVSDLTGKFKQPSGIVKEYTNASEKSLAMYAVTQLVNHFGQIVKNSRSINEEPSITSMATNVHNITTVYCDVFATLVFPAKNGKTAVEGVIQAIMLENSYRVSMASKTEAGIAMLEKTYNRMLEQSNFYQGKTLRFGRSRVEFIPVPSTEMKDVIMPAEVAAEYDLNVVQFLTNPKMQLITKKRGMLLYGPPGTGKTSAVKAMFKMLSEKHVTCIYISDASFDEQSVEDVFNFINKYLAPALVVFEDIDLMTPDRRTGSSRLIGPLLSALNGIEEQKKPIVILATTNRIEVLDGAITRPCRFDRRIKVDCPTESELNQIFYSKAGFKAPAGCFKSDVDTQLTGAHIEEIYRTAALLAEHNDKPINECVCEAVATVKKHFMIVAPKIIGFENNDSFGKEVPCNPEGNVAGYRNTNDPFQI